MSWSSETLTRIFEKTSGKCHICRRSLCRGNYGGLGRRGAWEVEHSVARANGGSDHLNNLFAAHISCNRAKKAKSSRAARAAHGFRSAPRSQRQKERLAAKYALAGCLAMALVPPPLRIAAAICGAMVGGLMGYNEDNA